MNEQIQRIEDKVQQLLKEYLFARKEIQRLHKENNRLQEQLQSYQEQADKLNNKANALKIINAGNMQKDSKTELEKRIDTYLKDIDKCLALLHS